MHKVIGTIGATLAIVVIAGSTPAAAADHQTRPSFELRASALPSDPKNIPLGDGVDQNANPHAVPPVNSVDDHNLNLVQWGDSVLQPVAQYTDEPQDPPTMTLQEALEVTSSRRAAQDDSTAVYISTRATPTSPCPKTVPSFAHEAASDVMLTGGGIVTPANDDFFVDLASTFADSARLDSGRLYPYDEAVEI
jgi:hypothetical protein